MGFRSLTWIYAPRSWAPGSGFRGNREKPSLVGHRRSLRVRRQRNLGRGYLGERPLSGPKMSTGQTESVFWGTAGGRRDWCEPAPPQGQFPRRACVIRLRVAGCCRCSLGLAEVVADRNLDNTRHEFGIRRCSLGFAEAGSVCPEYARG